MSKNWQFSRRHSIILRALMALLAAGALVGLWVGLLTGGVAAIGVGLATALALVVLLGFGSDLLRGPRQLDWYVHIGMIIFYIIGMILTPLASLTVAHARPVERDLFKDQGESRSVGLVGLQATLPPLAVVRAQDSGGVVAPEVEAQTERPSIGIANDANVTSNGDGSYAVTLTLTVSNYGNVPLSNLVITDDIVADFASVNPSFIYASGGTLTANPLWHGSGAVNILTSGQLLPIGARSDVYVHFKAAPTTTVVLGLASESPSGQNRAPVTANQVRTAAALMPADTITVSTTAYATGDSPLGLTSADASQVGLNPDANGNGDPTDDNDVTPVNFTENPAIGVAKDVASVTKLPNDVYAVVYTITVANLGDIVLSSIQVTDDLSTTFAAAMSYTVTSVSSPQLTANWPGGYNGSTNLDLLDGTDSLSPGQTEVILLAVNLIPGSNPGPYNNTAYAYGVSPIGAQVMDASDPGISPDPGQSAPTPLIFPTIALAKDLTTAAPARNGDPIVFTIRITNTSPYTITSLPLRDLYDNISLTYGYGGAYAAPLSTDTVDDGQITWNDVTAGAGLAPGLSSTVVVTFTAREDTTNLPGGEAVNTAVVDDAYASSPSAGPIPVMPKQDDAAIVIVRPTSLDVSAFGAGIEGTTIRLTWETASEVEIAGFNVLRAALPAATAFRVMNVEPILATQSGSGSGASYSYLDEAATPGVVYHYRLEILRTDGGTEVYGDAEATVATRRLYVPLIIR